jgi:hypothetical protein
MTYLEHDVLPFPSIKGIDLGPAMRQKVWRKKRFVFFSYLKLFLFNSKLEFY